MAKNIPFPGTSSCQDREAPDGGGPRRYTGRGRKALAVTLRAGALLFRFVWLLIMAVWVVTAFLPVPLRLGLLVIALFLLKALSAEVVS